ncbi:MULTISPECIES: 4-carboxy-4-hydroxy-2-oxoadipate aldolase/oxaloacetate decarboxylase [Paraburkholderia]|uniref:4-carboxy-4-hydroxy-2-oxoadipate aldolase/oxaloacetate decarboxylase n=1 Tax=Paraburkholderia TaxID=1822464 RepID=UPI0006B68F87|nr:MULTISPECIES: 4-carboxy-4-hydroxy-2-oxoadipate aldolase/oxaloacetate decarboxylase [Paraburkholderia]KPD14878.1 4-hydroxy-4-methyl-2-oxoglutarate aldolase [Burkholderia sp. ST111]MBK5153384.1 4-carboxy-4-hydroxy-2-oxoadipate aldolase/oxaloacetate decarboxylase [Burkholderia sp. R-69608]MBK5186013.1 4-carboxy-4-hydroxy-2-oxoadipate aldolase/oxaloacetate decarboxylase [Burkholderia sp. R-69749]CAE6898011.1 4-carboxy-4-hydroxy-2-oxoadipate aldolase [Paraburkholderia domus]CAE6971944.1 4-carbox
MSSQEISSASVQLLRGFGSATVYEAQGARGALDSGIKPIHPSMGVAGPAVTVDMRPADNLMLHYAMLKVKPGDVLVVDAKGFLEAGPWGDVFTEQAVRQGVAGLVINGAVRDARSIIDMGFPVFCRGLCIKGTGKNQPGKLNVPVCIGDVRINPGDIVIGDQDGVVVVPRDEVDDAIRSSQAREDKEEVFRARIRNGATTVELMGLEETLRRFNLD